MEESNRRIVEERPFKGLDSMQQSTPFRDRGRIPLRRHEIVDNHLCLGSLYP
jgi:hypothetical protein